METIGEHLKRGRKTCGYSLEDVARVTKINLRYLEAIENDEFSKIPGETFLLGFLRSYARFLGINEKEIIGKLKERKSLETQPVELPPPPPFPPKTIKILLPVGAGLIALLVIIVLFAGGRETSSIQNSKEAKKTEEVGVGPVDAKPVDAKPARVVQPVQTVKSAVTPVSLKLKAKELTWLQVEIDEREKKEALLRPGEEVLYGGKGKIAMILGNAGGVDITVNGKRHEPVGESGEVVRNIVITNTGMSKIAESDKEPRPSVSTPETSPLMNLPP